MIVFLWKLSSLNLVEIMVEAWKMDDEKTNFSCKEVSSDKQMELFGEPAYYAGHMCGGLKALPRDAGIKWWEPGSFQPGDFCLSPP